MATPIAFPKANFVWTGPTSEIGDLPVFRDGQVSISCWELTEEELAEVAATGRVWLNVQGEHPPSSISGDYPFSDEHWDGSR